MIQSLSYIGFTSPNGEAWLEFGPAILVSLLIIPYAP